ncbi:WD40 repeat-like protein [Amniculicola lignicola CBS 123094]|uniref:WD40 repeat-like protein n=1 Tax=Amniculicola lignicola CBS 123094 TaxID=1392246 RepID=A0A6A5WZH4_9PLEO|nr:WD40 repeat-like protein [Amniculicola lignicola CBS 123094]
MVLNEDEWDTSERKQKKRSDHLSRTAVAPILERPSRSKASEIPQEKNDKLHGHLQPGAASRGPGTKFTEEEDHFVIFLKEVKKYKWRDIYEIFPKYFPRRQNGGSVQTRYSQTINKRDRNQDPPRLLLPADFTTEVIIDWDTVHAEFPGSAQTSALVRESQAFSQQARQAPASRPRNESPGDDPSDIQRPRRDVQAVNYTWPRRHRTRPGEDANEYIEDDFVVADSRSLTPNPVIETPPPQEFMVGSQRSARIYKPMIVDFEKEDAALFLSTGRRLPYLASSNRLAMRNDIQDGEWDSLASQEWKTSIVHVDFSPSEVAVVEEVISKLIPSAMAIRSSSRRRRLQHVLRNQPEKKLFEISYGIRQRLRNRDRKSVDSFLHDLKGGQVRSIPQIDRLGLIRPDQKCSSVPTASTSSLIRQRELGLQSRRGWKAASSTLTYPMRNNVLDSMGLVYTYTGASSDVHTVAWSPDGECFAAGAVCVTDPHSMQYNRPNNLLYGTISERQIQELGEHYQNRKKTDDGPNSTHAMHVSQDSKLFTTVSSVAFSPCGQFMFSASYNKSLCRWETTRDGSQPKALNELQHRAPLDLMDVSCQGKVATASKRMSMNAVKVLTFDEYGQHQKFNFSSQKAQERPDYNILPTALKFDPHTGNMLLAGFGANKRQGGLDITGDICLWDVTTQEPLKVNGSARNVFDLAWNPFSQRSQPLFAVGCVAGLNVSRGMRSVVRLYDMSNNAYSRFTELECPALDMNDVKYCPYNDNILAVGCTSGSTYIWDLRNPDHILYNLTHGESLMPLEDGVDRELTDTGVRFISWGNNETRLYTGSSDGIVKVWDVTQSTSDVFIKDLVQLDSGVMCGAFNPDYSRLLLGEVNGSVDVLEVGRDDCSAKDAEKLRYLPYDFGDDEISDSQVSQSVKTISPDSGRAITSELLGTGQMQIAPFGGMPIRQAVQGQNYKGPFDNSNNSVALRFQSTEFQYNLTLAENPTSPCDILACKDSNTTHITSEEIGDSGRSKDRIPDELLRQWKALPNPYSTIPGRTKCSICARPARPLDPSNTDPDQTALCERCGFTCFRCCKDLLQFRDNGTMVVCLGCQHAWDVGALGYYHTTAGQGDRGHDAHLVCEELDVPRLERHARELEREKLEEWGEEKEFGDEVNALSDHYYGLTIQRPESPML